MPPVGEVSFELERFEWTADDRLEVDQAAGTASVGAGSPAPR